MFNISFMTCIKRYISHKSLEDQTLSRRNGCLIHSHSVTQPPDLGLWISRSSLVFILFWVECNQDKKSCNYLVVCNQDSKPCNTQFIKHVVFFIQPMRIEQFSHVFCIQYFFFFFFWYKKISGDSTPQTQKERCLSKHPKLSFLRGTFAVSHSRDVEG